ncbi:hypothetical protein KQX54_016079 [Cotesia glomerata]|uniref:Uncharacterized protein n=1 Tax=Cotesia glomerata TaxID=32391 RepID=A0AAV7I966_COTGL|nr:hypothetical protein KQX54_016079 [Cotesia glomerata]
MLGLFSAVNPRNPSEGIQVNSLLLTLHGGFCEWIKATIQTCGAREQNNRVWLNKPLEYLEKFSIWHSNTLCIGESTIIGARRNNDGSRRSIMEFCRSISRVLFSSNEQASRIRARERRHWLGFLVGICARGPAGRSPSSLSAPLL